MFFDLERSTHRAPLCRPDQCDGCIQLKSSRVDTNLLDTDSHSRGAERNVSSWSVPEASTVRRRAPADLRVAECKCCSWATVTKCFFLGGAVVLTHSFEGALIKGRFVSCKKKKLFLIYRLEKSKKDISDRIQIQMRYFDSFVSEMIFFNSRDYSQIRTRSSRWYETLSVF